MINLSDLGQVYIVCGKTNLRKGIDGLACLSSAEAERIVSKPFIEKAKDIGCCIKDLKMEK